MRSLYFALVLACSQGCGAPRTGSPPDGGADLTTPGGCVGLACQILDCASMGAPPTTITGRVFAPNGTLPLYNAIVYVPNASLQPLAEGVSCEPCGSVPGGSPLATTLSDETGSFRLEGVPAGVDIPLVVQLGKWRRRVTIPQVPACATTTLSDPEQARLPRNQLEGDLPRMAIATGMLDPMECLLLKIGIDPDEFTRPSEAGHVHLYHLNGQNLVPPVPEADDPAAGLYTNLTTLKRYDVVLFPCEGAEYQFRKSDAALQYVVDYTSAGGRIFTTHYGSVWIHRTLATDPNPPFPGVASWATNPSFPMAPFYANVDTSFPKGAAFRDWLDAVNALLPSGAAMGKLQILDPRGDVLSIFDPPAKRWLYSDPGADPGLVQHFTFNTPLGAGAAECGRVVYSDFHVSTNATIANMPFPESCKVQPMTAEEKALSFMFFDLASCVQDDDNMPITP